MKLKSSKNVVLSFRRFEFKYQIPKAIVGRIIPQLMKYMVWDEYAGDNGYYEVHSLYMDSPHFKCYHEKLDGFIDRKKIRIRSYKKTLNGDDIVFFELKRKSGSVILKDRAMVRVKDFELFAGNPFAFFSMENYKNDFFNEFVYDFSKYHMKPVTLVSYKRKPFYSKFDKNFRVTFDYDLSFAKIKSFDFNVKSECAHHDLAVMEVKFNGAMPRWFHDIIEMHSLTRDTFSKYCGAIEFCYGLPDYF
ncbi:MAG: polyphosphate polymerase domain-containing protein [Candidatus Gracilibacteria bacterium]